MASFTLRDTCATRVSSLAMSLLATDASLDGSRQENETSSRAASSLVQCMEEEHMQALMEQLTVASSREESDMALGSWKYGAQVM